MAVPTFLAAVLTLATVLPGQVEATVEAQSGPSMTVAVGVGGFSQTDQPNEIRVTLSSPVLVAGRLRIRGGDVAVSRPVEVPAGSEQTYGLFLPPLRDGTRLTVELLDTDGDPIVSESITTRLPSSEEMAVGVMGDADLVQTLGRVRTVVTDRPVAAFEVSADVPAGGLDVLDYLVVGRGAAAAVEDAIEWAHTGGRVVTDASLWPPPLGSEPAATPTDGVTRVEVGSGTVFLVDTLEGRSSDDWSEILRPTPLDFSLSSEGAMEGAGGLITAASEAGTRQVPSIPWLLFAIVGFAAVVGPVNFIVLSRLGKRDLAWVTIPLISLVAVLGFWVAGRQRIAGTALTHASVVVAEGDTRLRSAVLVTAGTAGERELAFDPEYRVFPEPSLFGSGAGELRLEGESRAKVDLDQLAFTGVGLSAVDPELALPEAEFDGEVVAVRNDSGLNFWGWGAISAGSSTVAAGELTPGASATVAAPRGGRGDLGWSFIDALINRRELWDDPARSSSLWSLSGLIAAETDPEGIYFIGLTDDFHPQVSVDGASVAPVGPTVVMVQVERQPDRQEAGRAAADVVDTGFVNWVDWGVARMISTDEMTLRFRLPGPGVEARLSDAQTSGVPAAAYEAWNWDTGGFEQIQPGAPLPSGSVSSDGEVYVRLVGADEFGDNPMSPSDIALEWGA